VSAESVEKEKEFADGVVYKGRKLCTQPLYAIIFCRQIFYSISQNTPQLAEVPKLTEGMNGQGRRHCRAIVLSEYLNKTRTRRGKIPAMGDVLKGHP
jgi:hypothetical protein